MTHFTVHNLNQKAIYWGDPTPTGSGGYTWADPVEIDCRWEDSNAVIASADGVQIVTRSSVQVAQDLEEEGMLLLGNLADLDSNDFNDPINAGAAKIMRFEKIPTIKGNYFFRRAFL